MEKKIFLELINTQGAHWNLARQGFAALDLSDGQPKILYILYYAEGIVQKELAAICGVKPSTLTVLLQRMEQQNMIRREDRLISGGKHAWAIFLTETGREKATQTVDFVEELETRSFKDFSQTEREMLFSLLERVQNNLK